MSDEKPFRRVEIDKPDAAGMSDRRTFAQDRPLTDDDIRMLFERTLKMARGAKARGMAVVFELDPTAAPKVAFFASGSPATREGTLLAATTELLNFAVVEFGHAANDAVTNARDRVARAAVKQFLSERKS